MVSGTDAAEVSNIPPMTAQEVIQKTRYENIDLIAGAPNLLDVNLAILKNKVGRQDNILKEALKPVQGNYDVCIVDNPPDSNIAVLNGLEIIDDVIALTLPNQFSLKGVEQIQFALTESCYEIMRELRGKGYEIFPYIRGGKTSQKWPDRVINERKRFNKVHRKIGGGAKAKKLFKG